MLKHNSDNLHAHGQVPAGHVIAPPTGKKINKCKKNKEKKQTDTGSAEKAGYFLNVVEKTPLICPGLNSPRDGRHILSH